ncbi:hypothetical protein OEZ85_006812 [Tetradesmus obliquus]|uniref:RBR-type E3 ubiquitin transferase n=1 Tax=Tetradesmus obliquus TaxID=3088 RepID=A0ABY8TW75_TETOB|nr:hypothetical protein OEZ85_006812 [Tetradesmus obliquus]
MEADELLFAKEQLQELKAQWQCHNDARMALSLFLADSGQQSALGSDGSEQLLLQEQMATLEAYVASLEDQKAASLLDDAEAANNRASQLLAESLSARESWDVRVAQHDARFARALSVCRSEEWEEQGDLLSDPLQGLPPRPGSPDLSFNNQQQHGLQEQQRVDAPNSSGMHLMDRPVLVQSGTCVVQPSSGHAAQPSAQADDSSSHWLYLRERPVLVWSGTGVVQPSSRNAAQAGPQAGSSNSGGRHQQAQAPGTCSSSDAAAAAADKGKRPLGGRAGPGEQRLDCAICFESHPLSSMVAAALPQQMASSSSAAGRCGHHFCQECMRRYACEQVQARRYPLCCPSPSCQECLAHEDVLQLLQDQPALQVYEMLVMEHCIDSSLRAYCPYKDCSCLLERPGDEDEAAAGGQDLPFECPACQRTFCLSCGITGWHTGMTCAQFQALPPELRSVEDAAMLRMAQQQAWKRCPAAGCGHVVERTEGCNHMRCRCGVDFCYACGSAYKDSEPTADNVHGTPACTCPLFSVPEEPEEAAAAARPVVLRRAKPWRNGRFVSRTRCRHSASIYDCPNGLGRCWFWHDEDDEPADEE